MRLNFVLPYIEVEHIMYGLILRNYFQLRLIFNSATLGKGEMERSFYIYRHVEPKA